MPIFQLHLRKRTVMEPDDEGMEFRDLHHAYLEVCRSIPDVAREALIAGHDPTTFSYIICDYAGHRLLEVRFDEILSPLEWRLRRARTRPHSGPRSAAARNDLALGSFRRMFSSLNVGCVLMTPDLHVVEMNTFGAKHSHVDPEAIRGTSILDIFVDLKGQPNQDFTQFMRLAQAGAVSEVVDLPYYVLDAEGETADGWWNARTWPIFDDDDHLLGLVEWAEPLIRPSAGGSTLLRTAPVGSSPRF